MSRQRRATLWFGGTLVMLGALALSACGGTSAASNPTATATPSAQSILQNVSKGSYKDGAFTITISSSADGTAFDGSGSGKFTTSPSRASMTISATIAGQAVEIDVVSDDATSTTYTRIPLLSTQWTKSSSDSSGFGTGSLGSFDMTNPTLVGTEQINGVNVYHVQGQDTTDTTATDDLYARTDNYQPVRFSVKSTGSNATIDFTSFNTGITIDLPPTDQVQG